MSWASLNRTPGQFVIFDGSWDSQLAGFSGMERKIWACHYFEGAPLLWLSNGNQQETIIFEGSPQQTDTPKYLPVGGRVGVRCFAAARWCRGIQSSGTAVRNKLCVC